MFLYYIFMLVGAVYAVEIIPGACPVVTPYSNFNWEEMDGHWYAIASNDGNFAVGGQCGGTTFTVGTNSIQLRVSQVLSGVQLYVDASAVYDPAVDDESVLDFSFVVGGLTTVAPVHVLATDYINYAIAYVCIDYPSNNEHIENLWILSRNTTLEGESLQAVNGYFWRYGCGLDTYRDQLMDGNFSDPACAYSSSVPL